MALMKTVALPDGGCEHVEMSAEEEAAIRAEWAANDAAQAASTAAAVFTPAQIVAAFTAWGVADQILGGIDRVTLARFYTAQRVLVTDQHLVAALASVGKTTDDLKQQIKG